MSAEAALPAQPNAWRVLLGFLLAPALPAALLSTLWSGGLGLLVSLLYWAYPPAIVLGVPLYVLLRRHMQPRIWIFLLAGGFVGVAVPALLGLWFLLSPHREPGLNEGLFLVAHGFALGALGGLVFWLRTVWPGGPTRIQTGADI